MQAWNKLNEQDLIDMYDKYNTLNLDQFKKHCLSLLSRAKSPNSDIAKTIEQSNNKDKILKTTNNFIMSGHGYKVIK